MIPIWLIGFLTTFIGIGIGGVIACCINGFSNSIGTIYAVCTGMILGLISFEIAPEAIRLGSWVIFSIGFLAGVILFNLMHRGVHRGVIGRTKSQKYRKTGLFLSLIIAIHNLPMGVILGVSEHSDFSGLLLKALVLHNIPEGMILFTPLFLAGFRFFKMIFLSIIVAIPVALGVFIGGVIGMQTGLLWSFLISLAVGTIYMVTIKEILPESIRHSSNRTSILVALISFFLMGGYLVYL